MRTSGLIAASLALGFVPTTRAEDPIASPTDNSPILQPAKPNPPATTAPATHHEHLVSGETAGRVSTGLPKFTPRKTTDGKTETELPDLREIDKPKNGIIRLPQYTVTKPKEKKLPGFKVREMLTYKGLVELALKQKPGLRFGNIFGMNNGIALEMYLEQEHLDDLAEIADAVANARNSGDPVGGDFLAQERYRLAYRPSVVGPGGR